MQIADYIAGNWPTILKLLLQHLSIVSVAVGLAVLTGVPLGILAAQHRRFGAVILYVTSMIMTVPSMALFGLLIPVLALVNHGIGYVPAVIAIFLYSQLPIVSNTYAAISSVDPALKDAAKGMGMTSAQRLCRVELPIVLPVIIAGIRTAAVINVGVTSIAAYIGAGGLGLLIRMGISQTDARQVLVGALFISLLALAVDRLFAALQSRLRSPGMAPI